VPEEVKGQKKAKKAFFRQAQVTPQNSGDGL